MSERKRMLCAWSVLIVGVACIAIGVARGEADTVLRKAVMICLECMGIG